MADEAHVAAQKDLYRARREVFGGRLLSPVVASNSEAGLYLSDHLRWSPPGIQWPSGRLGIIAGPGVFYGEDGRLRTYRLTASDEAVKAAGV